MSQVELTSIGNRFVAIFNEQDPGIADEIFASNFVAYVSGAPTPTLDREGWKTYLESLRAGYHVLHLKVQDMIAAGDKLVLRVVLHGTHTNTFQGLSPTGKQIAFDGIAMHRVEDGQVVEHWGGMDLLSMMQQLGALPG